MWLHQEIEKVLMGETRETNLTVELQDARKRHVGWVQKTQKLEAEKNVLDERLCANQLAIVTGKNELNSKLEELKAQKRKNMDLMQRMEISSMHLEMLRRQIDEVNSLKMNALTELKPIGEKLSFKWDVVDCLEKMLVGTRLETAEQDVMITQLKKHERELNRDVAAFKALKPSTVSTWQQEFLDARIKEADVILEFDKIKRMLATIKRDLEDKKIERDILDNESSDFFSIRINIKDKYADKLKEQEELSNNRIAELQNEMDLLRMQIKKLQKIREDTDKQLYFNEETKIHLFEVRSSIYQRLQQTATGLQKQFERNKKFEQNMNKELSQIDENANSKDLEILRLTHKIQELHESNGRLTVSNEESMNSLNETTVNNLEDQVRSLEEEIQFKETSSIK